ncbi:MAG: 23S rRNA pseudouridine1911/1915/1917 synthase [Saprospiraceae bacterium]|jgi:23S rRNA pseudouridine1911/1915/1917 synthase
MKNQPLIIHQDEDVVIINKPANYLSIPDRFKPDLPNIQQFLKTKFGQIFTVHRLDRETSGIMIFARHDIAHKELSTQFENRIVEKIYLALTSGNIHNEEDIIEKAIGKHPAIPGKMIVTKKGKLSVSAYKVIERFKHYTLVEVNIKTGRTHQIRVHMQALGYPLAVDPLYSKKEAFFLSEVKGKKYKKQRDEEERPLISRCTLHAYKLSFDHPTSGERLTFTTEVPKDFSALLKQLRKWGS